MSNQNSRKPQPWLPRTFRRSWQRKPKGECGWSLSCRKKATTGFYCRAHADKINQAHNRIRAMHRRLGFCVYCKSRAEPGYLKCRKHLRSQMEAQRRWQAKVKKARGWRYVRVAI